MDSATETVPPAVHEALVQGRKLEAVMMLSHQRDLELKTAKEAVDRYLAQHPGLHTQWRRPYAHADAHWRQWAVFSALVALLLAYLRLGARF